MLAFSHIEKAAGTTLIHILRRIYLLRFGAVRPLRPKYGPYLTLRDLRLFTSLNPKLQCISGHAVVPHGELQELGSKIQFITQLREPVARAISQYKFWRTRMGKQLAPEQFLQHHTSSNFQTKKIAGIDDLELAKDTIRNRYLLAGTVEHFNEFLVLLADKLDRPLKLFIYDRRNEATANSEIQITQDFVDELRARNQVDAALYRWVRDELQDEYIASFAEDFQSQLAHFRRLQQICKPPIISPAIDFVYRNVYWKPVTGVIRKSSGLPYYGSYGSF